MNIVGSNGLPSIMCDLYPMYIVMISCPFVPYFILLGRSYVVFHLNASIDLTERSGARSPVDQLPEAVFKIHFGLPAKLLYRMVCV